MEATTFKKIPPEALPKDTTGRATLDLYVHMPATGKYIRYIAAGDEIEMRKVEAIRTHPEPNFFVREGDTPLVDPTIVFADTPGDFPKEVLGKALENELKDVFIYISGDEADPGAAIKRFEGMTDKLVGAIAPEVKTLNEHLKKQAQYLNLMSDAAAISTIALICAYANGFDSRKSYRELSYATLVMDISLAEFSKAQMDQYYLNRESLPPDVLKSILFHPMRSYQLAEQKLRSLSDITMQLILTHHELFNGKGFPRGIRTEALFPIARVLSLAVDLFEHLKKSELSGTKEGLMDILERLRDEPVEPHMRRHNKKLIESVIVFLGTQGAESPVAPTL